MNVSKVDQYAYLMEQKKTLEDQIESLKIEIENERDDGQSLMSGENYFVEWGNPYTTKRFNIDKAMALGYLTEEQIEECKIEGKESVRMTIKPMEG